MIDYYLNLGINVIATNEHKQAIFPWKIYQSERITKDKLNYQLADSKAKGIAIICGAISGNIEVIDIDTKYEVYDLWSAIKDRVPQYLYEKMHIVSTKNKGIHLYYKCECIGGNVKLASRYPTKDELQANSTIKHYTIIETRGEGGYVVAPPTDGYAIIQQGINIISIEEREILMEVMRSFNEIIEEAVIEAHNRPSTNDYGISPFEDYNNKGDITTLMSNNGWSKVGENSERIYFLRPGSNAKHSGSWNKEMRLFNVFSVNTCFEVGKGYKLAAVYTFMQCDGDFKRSAKELVDQGYGEKKTSFGDKLEKSLFSKKQNGESDDELITYLVKSCDKSVTEAKEIVNDLVAVWGNKLLIYWDIDRNGQPSINRYRLQRFLTEQGGFRLYFYDANSTIYRLIRVKDGIVEEASTEQIKRFIKDHIDRLPDKFDGISPQILLELIYKGASILFSDAFFEFFDRANIDFLRDTKDLAYFPFINGVVVVTKTSINLKTYGDLNKCIWKSQVIQHHVVLEDDIELDKIEYFNFIKRVCGDDTERYIYGLSIIGYLLHQYKDPSRPYAVILAEETDNEDKGGGTGKGIFVKALSYIINTIRVDGKNFKIDKNFAFQRVDIDTRLVAIEDTRKNVDFEGFYSIITEGITIEKKNKDELFIPYIDSPKILFTTNYTIPSSGVHAKRRQRVFEFAPYFGAKHTPEDEFGHKLFDDWDKDEWNRFYNLLFDSLQGYLLHGIQVLASSEKMARKGVKNQFGEEFLEFFDYLAKEGAKEWVKLDGLYNEFLTTNGYDKKDYSVKRFRKGLDVASEMLNVTMEIKKDHLDRGKRAIKLIYQPDLQPD